MKLSPDPAARRRLAVLAAAAGAALVVGLVAGAGSGGDGGGDDGARESGPAAVRVERERAAQRAVDRLTLAEQVGQVTISSFDGTVRPDYIRRRLRDGETAGVILFGRNAGGWRGLTHSIERAAGGQALVMVDQEGGDIRTIEEAGPVAGQPSQGDPASVGRAAEDAGRGLRAAGVNVNLAPVADVPGPGSVMASRAFAGGPEGIAARVRASVTGLARARVGATAKHFPGLGGSAVNTDDAPATVAGDLEQDLVPFRAAIAADVPLVMLSHALYPGLDPNAIASQSRAVATGLLRDRLGFRGVAVTDSMEAQAVVGGSDVASAAERSVAAGADLVLLTGSASWNLVYPRLLERARTSPPFRARIRQAAARVLALKRALLG